MSESEIEEREDQFVADAEIAVAVLGKLDNFILIDYILGHTDRAKFDAARAEAEARGFFLCGLLRAKAGEPDVLFMDPRGVSTMSFAAMEWVLANRGYFRQSAPVQTGDWVQWANGLYAAQDNRPDYGPN